MPKFIIDEDLPRSIGTVLAEAGHEIFDIRDHGLRGAADGRIFNFAQSKKAIINRQIVLALSRLDDADLSGNLIIVEPGKIKIRRHE